VFIVFVSAHVDLEVNAWIALKSYGKTLERSCTIVMGHPPWKPSHEARVQIGGRKWSRHGIAASSHASFQPLAARLA